MEQKNEVDVEETLDLPTVVDGEEDLTDWKAEATKLQEKAIKQRQATKELKAKLKELTPAEKKQETIQAKSGELDNGDKALLVAYGVKTPDEIALAKTWMKRTGDDIDVMISDDIFNAKLTALREARDVAKATPSGSKRTGNTVKDTAEYWTQKYLDGTELNELPREFRMKAIQAKTKGQANGKMFYNS